jgi:hypothetical protein
MGLTNFKMAYEWVRNYILTTVKPMFDKQETIGNKQYRGKDIIGFCYCIFTYTIQLIMHVHAHYSSPIILSST